MQRVPGSVISLTPRQRLDAHLRSWLGTWPPTEPVTVVGSTRRTAPGWDGRVRPFVGVASPLGTVLSVPPDRVEAVKALGSEREAIERGLAEALGREDWQFHEGVMRWSEAPADTDAPGVWVPTDHPDVPGWLRPFNGEVLVGYEDGQVAAGVGRKQHDRFGHELAVVTEEGFRGRGWARRLVAQAAHRVLADGAVPTYLHPQHNIASARTAEAAGFCDRGWRILGLFAAEPG